MHSSALEQGENQRTEIQRSSLPTGLASDSCIVMKADSSCFLPHALTPGRNTSNLRFKA